jgi:hypothetical protein
VFSVGELFWVVAGEYEVVGVEGKVSVVKDDADGIDVIDGVEKGVVVWEGVVWVDAAMLK